MVWAKQVDDPFEVLTPIQDYVTHLKVRHATKQSQYTAVRSFFLHNRVFLPPDLSFRIHSDLPPIERKLTIDNVRELIGLATQPLRSMILVKWMALLDTSGLIWVSNNLAETVVKGLRKGDQFVKLPMPGRKASLNQQPFYTFIGHDALENLREYFERERGWPAKGEPIWVYRKG